MQNILSSFLRDQSGATALEYAFIGMSICVVLVAAVFETGVTLTTIMDQVVAGFAN